MAQAQVAQGVLSFTAPEALLALERILRGDNVQRCFMHIDWQKATAFWQHWPRLAHLCRDAQARRAAECDGADSLALLRARLVDQVAGLLGTSAEEVDQAQPLIRLGLDSLMALELRNWMQERAHLQVTQLELLDGATIEQLLARLSGDGPHGAAGDAR
jgi:aryl carrier-like protein